MRVELRTICTATVKESWVVDLPDDTEDPMKAAEAVVLGDDTQGTVLSVSNDEVYDERDREVLG